MCVHVCVCACVRACVYACVCACAQACMHTYMYVCGEGGGRLCVLLMLQDQCLLDVPISSQFTVYGIYTCACVHVQYTSQKSERKYGKR